MNGQLPYFAAMPLIASLTDPIVQVGGRRRGRHGPRRGLRADAARERLHPRAQRGHHAVRRLQRLERRVQPVRRHRGRRRSANLVGSWIAYGVGYVGPRGHPREARQEAPHQEVPPRVGGPLVRAPRRRHRLLHPHAADHPHVHLAARGRGADAVLALHASSPSLGCIPWVLLLTFIGKEAGDNWESWKDSLHYVDYAVAAAIVIGIVWLVVRNRRRPSRARLALVGRWRNRPSGLIVKAGRGATMTQPSTLPTTPAPAAARALARAHARAPRAARARRAARVRGRVPHRRSRGATAQPVGWFADESLRDAMEASMRRLARGRAAAAPARRGVAGRSRADGRDRRRARRGRGPAGRGHAPRRRRVIACPVRGEFGTPARRARGGVAGRAPAARQGAAAYGRGARRPRRDLAGAHRACSRRRAGAPATSCS